MVRKNNYPTDEYLDSQIDLMKRGLKNGAQVKILNEVELKNFLPMQVF